MNLKLATTVEDDRTIVQVSGELDMDTAPELDDVINPIATSDTAHLVIDMTGVAFMDSTGLAVILSAHKNMHQRGATLTLEGPNKYIIKTLTITGLDEVFEIRSSPKNRD